MPNIFLQYEKSYQISNGAFSNVFCVKLRSAKKSLFAAKVTFVQKFTLVVLIKFAIFANSQKISSQHLARASCTAEREAEILGALPRSDLEWDIWWNLRWDIWWDIEWDLKWDLGKYSLSFYPCGSQQLMQFWKYKNVLANKNVLCRCSQVVAFVEAFHCKFHTIVVTEFLAGKH